MEERINEIVRLIDTQLAIVPDNPIEESSKARTLKVRTKQEHWRATYRL